MSTPREAQTPGADTSRPHPARIYDYALGGKNLYRFKTVA
jgi:hypothetical protein